MDFASSTFIMIQDVVASTMSLGKLVNYLTMGNVKQLLIHKRVKGMGCQEKASSKYRSK